MTFIFFSFHVHEKTILLPLMPVLINFDLMKFFFLDFSLVAAFSNYNMFINDIIADMYVVLFIMYLNFGNQISENLLRKHGGR